VDSITPEEIKRCAYDFSYFCDRMLDEPVKPFQSQLADIFDTHKRSVVQIPRGHGKSTTVGIKYTLWKARFSPYTDHPYYLMITSAAKHQSSEIMSTLQNILYTNDYFSDIVPPKNSKLKFNMGVLQLLNGCVIYCRPYNRRVVSVQCDRVYIDEASKVDNPEIFFKDITPIVNNKGGNIMLTGTVDNETDLLMQCMNKDEYYKLSLEACNEDFENILWPERFPKHKLMAIYNNDGPASFNQNYRGKLTAAISQVFPPDSISHVCSKEHGFNVDKPKDALTFTGVDLAISEKGDFIVINTIALLPDNRLWIIDGRTSRGTDPEIVRMSIEQVNKVYNIQKCLVDESLFGKGFIRELINKNYVPAEGYSFQPQLRIALLDNLVRNFPRLIIPRHQDHPEALKYTNRLLHELSGVVYGSTKTGMRTYETKTAHDDTVMALALSVMAASAYNPQQYNNPTIDSTNLTPTDLTSTLDFDTSPIFSSSNTQPIHF